MSESDQMYLVDHASLEIPTFQALPLRFIFSTGVMAVILGNDPTLTPKDVWDKLKADATTGVLKNKGLRSADRMLYVAP